MRLTTDVRRSNCAVNMSTAQVDSLAWFLCLTWLSTNIGQTLVPVER